MAIIYFDNTIVDFFAPFSTERLSNLKTACENPEAFGDWSAAVKKSYEGSKIGFWRRPNIVGRKLIDLSVSLPGKGLQDCVLSLRSDFLQVSVSLQRYYLVHQKFPETLHEMVPDFLDRVPSDIFFPGYKIEYDRENQKLTSIGRGDFSISQTLNRHYEVSPDFGGTFEWDFYKPASPLTNENLKPRIKISRPFR